MKIRETEKSKIKDGMYFCIKDGNEYKYYLKVKDKCLEFYPTRRIDFAEVKEVETIFKTNGKVLTKEVEE